MMTLDGALIFLHPLILSPLPLPFPLQELYLEPTWGLKFSPLIPFLDFLCLTRLQYWMCVKTLQHDNTKEYG